MLIRILQIKPQHLCTWGHQGICSLVTHMENPVHHSTLSTLEGSILHTLLNQILDLVLSNRIINPGADTKKIQHHFCCSRQYHSKWCWNNHNVFQGPLAMNQSTLWILHSYAPWKEFTKHERKIGNHHNTYYQRNLTSILSERYKLSQIRSQQHTGADTEQYANKRNTYLKHWRHLWWILQQLQSLFGLLIPIISHFFQTAFVTFQKRCLRQWEKNINKYQNNNNYEP